jgi:hypothetical protein
MKQIFQDKSISKPKKRLLRIFRAGDFHLLRIFMLT